MSIPLIFCVHKQTRKHCLYIVSVMVITRIFCLGQEEEAEAVLREAITVMPTDPHFYFSLGVLLAKRKQLEVYI